MARCLLLCWMCLGVLGYGGRSQAEGIPWSKLKSEGKLAGGRIIPPDDKTPFEQLELTGGTKPGYIPILSFGTGVITTPHHNIMGRFRYQGVRGQGYFAMWVRVKQGRVYFQRSIITRRQDFFSGDSDWGNFYNPFTMPNAYETGPEAVQFSLYLPGPGKVYLAPIDLVRCQRADLEKFSYKRERTVSELHVYSWLIAGLVGVFLVSGVAVGRGKAKVLVQVVLALAIVVGVVLLVCGTVGLIRSRDWWVSGPILVLGGIQVVVPGILFLISRKYYRKAATP